MSKLILDSLEIKNFRAFKHLRIEKLGRVNLIVGKNNVGKTSVLEALWLYARRGDPYSVFQLLKGRGEMADENIQNNGLRRNAQEVQQRLYSLSYLFHGREKIHFDSKSARVGIANLVGNALSISTGWPLPLEASSLNAGEHTFSASEYSVPSLDISIGDYFNFDFPLNQDYVPGFIHMRESIQPLLCILVKDEGLNAVEVRNYWDSIVLTDLEDEVLVALRIIAPEVQALNLIGGLGQRDERKAVVKILGTQHPIPLRSLGGGMNRMLGSALALVNAKDGMLLIDEVDTGLHYSVLPEMWKLIFEVAHRLNVQVFATSHSWDCIQAFQQAAADNKEADGVLIRLEQRKDGIGAVTFDEQELAIVTREQIEVR